MGVSDLVTITHGANRFTCRDAGTIAQRAMAAGGAKMVLIDLRQTTETCTGALARLILLRQDLLKSGRDLRIFGLGAQANGLYEINRISDVLPRDQLHVVATRENRACRLNNGQECLNSQQECPLPTGKA